MNERSHSLPKLSTESSIKRERSLRFIDSRLKFPLPDDPALFLNAGRKHFENHSDKMLKIILPQRFAAEKPLVIKKEFHPPHLVIKKEFHPPHLVRQSWDRLPQANKNSIGQSAREKMTVVPNVSLRDKIEDELDRMKKSMEIQKKTKITPVLTEQPKPIPKIKDQASQSPKISPIFSITPIMSLRKDVSLQSNASQLLYNPENKQKYDSVLKGRWMSPTNLSTGLSII